MIRTDENGIFRISDEKILTPDLLSEYITAHKIQVANRYKKLRDAYRTDYRIFHEPRKAPHKPDNRIAVNFAKYITDTMSGFCMGEPVRISSADEDALAYVIDVNSNTDADDIDAELTKMCSIFGRAYDMYYVDEAGEIGITALSPMESFIIYDENIVEQPRYFIRYYKDTEGIERGSFSDEDTITYFICSPSVHFTETRVHGFGGVPAAEYMENAERIGLFEPVLSMIDAYNKAISEKANDVDYFADAYLKILGARLEEDDLKHIRDDRIINFDGIGDGSITVDFLDKPHGDDTQEHLIDRLERLIFQISMVANISDETFGASSGIALKYKLQAMQSLAKTKNRKFSASLKRRWKMIFSNPVSGMDPSAWADLDFRFTLSYPPDILSEAQTAGALSGIVSKETQLSVLSMVPDVQAEMEKMEAEAEEEYGGAYPTARTGENEE